MKINVNLHSIKVSEKNAIIFKILEFCILAFWKFVEKFQKDLMAHLN